MKINITVYALEVDTDNLVHRSRDIYEESLNLNVNKKHFILIVDFDTYCGICKCQTWDILGMKKKLLHNVWTCQVATRKIFPAAYGVDKSKLPNFWQISSYWYRNSEVWQIFSVFCVFWVLFNHFVYPIMVSFSRLKWSTNQWVFLLLQHTPTSGTNLFCYKQQN